jgi:hypothetical protein
MTMSDQAITIAWIEKLRSNPPQAFYIREDDDGGKCAMGYLDRHPKWLNTREASKIVWLNDTYRYPLPKIAEHIRERAIHYGVLKVGEVADPVTRKEAVAHVV